MNNFLKNLVHPQPKKILLGQLSGRGDCLYATAIARQIKHDYPKCHLTWAISAMYADLLDNNPYVDALWKISMPSHEDTQATAAAWYQFEKEARERQQQGDFDEIYLTQLYPNNLHNFDGTIRSSIFRGYPHPINVPISPVIRLTHEENQRVEAFIAQHELQQRSKVFLFECGSLSKQTFLTPEFALNVANKLLEQRSDLAVILSSHQAIETNNPAIIDGSSLSFRENAALLPHCHLIIGGSSGISWLSTAEGLKKIPTIQLLHKEQSVFASMKHDFDYFKLDSSHIIEMNECSEEYLTQCLMDFCVETWDVVLKKYHQKIPLNFNYYFAIIDENLKKKRQMEKYFTSISHTAKRYGQDFSFDKYIFFNQDIEGYKSMIAQLKAENLLLKQISEERLQLINQLHTHVANIQHKKLFFSIRKVFSKFI